MFYNYYKVMQIYEVKIFPDKSMLTLDWINGISTIFLSYICTPVFFYLRGELKHKTKKRVKKVIKYTIATEYLLYALIANVGYFCFGNNLVPPVLTLRNPLRKKIKITLAGMNDILMQIIQYVFIVVTLLHVPANLFSFRDQIYTYFEVSRTLKNHVIISVFTTFGVFFVPTIYPNVLGILGFMGGVFVMSVGLTFPLIITMRILGKF